MPPIRDTSEVESRSSGPISDSKLANFTNNVSTISEMDDDALRARAALQVVRVGANWLGTTDASPYAGERGSVRGHLGFR